MVTALRALLLVLGVSALLICLSILVLGPTATAQGFETGFTALTGWRGRLSPKWPPTIDSELRFYAPLFGAYGVLALLAAQDLARRDSWLPWLAAVFFIGGLGRAISFGAVGPPHPLFVVLMGLELALPPILIALWLGARRSYRGLHGSTRTTRTRPLRRRRE
jgi:hypothetical protein